MGRTEGTVRHDGRRRASRRGRGYGSARMASSSRGGEIRDAVEADWLEKEDPSRHRRLRRALRRSPRSPRPGIRDAEAVGAALCLRVVPRSASKESQPPSKPRSRRCSRRSTIAPSLSFRLPPPRRRARAGSSPSIPREEKESVPPPRNRRSKPPARWKPASPEFARLLTLFDLMLLGAGASIGVGIFRTPSQVAAAVPSAAGIVFVWALGGIVTLAGALSFAELGAAMPRAGRQYAG